MSKKYVIEIKPEYEDTTKGVMVLGARESNLYVDTLAIEDLEELNSDYINEHYSDLQDTAYQRGFDDAHRISEEEYHRGLEDAWEAAKKLFSSMADSDIEKAFPIEWNNGGFNALMNLQPQEAIEKLKAYEKKHKAEDEIRVGDIVDVYGNIGVVTYTYENTFDVVMNDGSVGEWKRDDLKKTGRHFDIQKILEEMRND